MQSRSGLGKMPTAERLHLSTPTIIRGVRNHPSPFLNRRAVASISLTRCNGSAVVRVEGDSVTPRKFVGLDKLNSSAILVTRSVLC